MCINNGLVYNINFLNGISTILCNINLQEYCKIVKFDFHVI